MSHSTGIAGGRRTAAEGGRGGARLVAGLLLVLLALVVFAGSRLAADHQHHAYDPQPTPPQAYRLVAGATYQLSTPGGVAALRDAGVTTGSLSCAYRGSDGIRRPMSLASTVDDDRDLNVFATWQAPAAGEFGVSCLGLDRVFIDDAAGSGTDVAGALVVLTTVLGFAGVALCCSGGYARSTVYTTSMPTATKAA